MCDINFLTFKKKGEGGGGIYPSVFRPPGGIYASVFRPRGGGGGYTLVYPALGGGGANTLAYIAREAKSLEHRSVETGGLKKASLNGYLEIFIKSNVRKTTHHITNGLKTETFVRYSLYELVVRSGNNRSLYELVVPSCGNSRSGSGRHDSSNLQKM